MTMYRRSTLLAVVTAAIGCGVAFGPAASAAPALPGAPSRHDIGVLDKLSTSSTVVGRLATLTFPGASHVKIAARSNVSVAGDHVAVYTPTAEFVAGKSAVPATLAYVATPATTGSGQPATLWAKRSSSGWRVFNVASGSDEQHYAARAAGGYLLDEPQVNAWYAVHGNTVTALHATGAGIADGTTMSLAAYQQGLAARYGDKLPGSSYDRKGMAGGYGAHTVTRSGSSNAYELWLGGGGGLLALGAGGLALRRRH